MIQVQTLSLYATTAPGVEDITARELAAHGLVPTAVEPGGVAFEADVVGMATANLQLRTASRVLLRIGRFSAKSFIELERKALKLSWDGVLTPEMPLTFRVTSKKSRLYHENGIAERFAQWLGRSASGAVSAEDDDAEVVEDVARQLIVIRVHRDIVTVSADSSGALLHRRGYRLQTAKAPLRENLAAAVLLAAGYDGSAPLLDPMCGSGTFPIEAGLMARHIPPGWRRTFACERWPMVDADRWAQLRTDAATRILPAAPAAILASDRDAGAIAATIANAERAGVRADIDARQCDVGEIAPPAGPGLITVNPPYGIRVDDAAEARRTVTALAETLRARCRGWTVAMVAPELVGGLGLAEAFGFSNGGIRVSAGLGQVP